MNSDKTIKTEQINAYVDDQLATEVKAELLKQSQEDEQLADNICQTRVLKEMVKLAYQNPPRHQSENSPARRHGRWQYGIAASVLVLIGIMSGWHGAWYFANNATLFSQQVQLDKTVVNKQNILLHISTADSATVEHALASAEQLLKDNSEKPFQLQVLVNAEGIKILQADESPYVERIRKLALNNNNVAFLACQRSIERQKLKGINVHLVKEAKVIPEALAAIVSRLHQGWVYIRA